MNPRFTSFTEATLLSAGKALENSQLDTLAAEVGNDLDVSIANSTLSAASKYSTYSRLLQPLGLLAKPAFGVALGTIEGVTEVAHTYKTNPKDTGKSIISQSAKIAGTFYTAQAIETVIALGPETGLTSFLLIPIILLAGSGGGYFAEKLADIAYSAVKRTATASENEYQTIKHAL